MDIQGGVLWILQVDVHIAIGLLDHIVSLLGHIVLAPQVIVFLYK